jgi:hypothetical protein
MINYLDTNQPVENGRCAFAVFDTKTCDYMYGTVREIQNGKAAFGWEGNIKWTDQVFEHFPKCCLRYVPYVRKNLPSPQITLF